MVSYRFSMGFLWVSMGFLLPIVIKFANFTNRNKGSRNQAISNGDISHTNMSMATQENDMEHQ